jgi:hypothetical protein
VSETIGEFRDEILGLKNCAHALLVGEQLGKGATRRVYALKHNPNLVLKVEYAARQFCNVAEYEIWKEVAGTELEKFFAPVVDIDVWGGALLMMRTKPITQREFIRHVNQLPRFMCDTHWANFGKLNGRIVCHDYGYHVAIAEAVKSRKMKVVLHG